MILNRSIAEIKVFAGTRSGWGYLRWVTLLPVDPRYQVDGLISFDQFQSMDPRLINRWISVGRSMNPSYPVWLLPSSVDWLQSIHLRISRADWFQHSRRFKRMCAHSIIVLETIDCQAGQSVELVSIQTIHAVGFFSHPLTRVGILPVSEWSFLAQSLLG